ncbi:MAG: HD domain-containing protein [Erysipelotrichaceae bacterium]|nr:HD domain-containing protein [Erysipelotrichaceae bacterium]
MREKTSEMKVLRDPIHEYIHIEDQLIWDLLGTREVQRLKRIHQLGTTYQVYHTAEHSRFAHSLGVYEIVRRMVIEISGIDELLSAEDKLAVMAAALLHDIGHGPFSHIFETISKIHHESFTQKIILEDSEVHRVLEKAQAGFSKTVASILDHTHPKAILTQFVSGQLDADRMDYLLRDAYFTGTSYGQYDIERILRTFKISHDKLTIKESGIHSIEDYIMARYHMYYQVYYHPVGRAVEAILIGFFKRLKDRVHNDPSFINNYPMFKILIEKPELNAFYHLDEASCFYGFHLASESDDMILKDLANRFLDRDLFEYQDVITDKQRDEIKTKVEKTYDSRYYFYQDEMVSRPYTPYSEEGSLIYISCADGSIKELSQVSNIVLAIVNAKPKDDKKVYFPKEIL